MGRRRTTSAGVYRYEIIVRGRLGGLFAGEAFGELEVRTGSSTTVLFGEFDQDALHRALVRVRDLGVELLAVRRIDSGSGPGAGPPT